MKENYMYYAKDVKEYFTIQNREDFRISGGDGLGGGMRGGGGAFRGGMGGGGGAFRGPAGGAKIAHIGGGGGYGAGGYPWGAHGYGKRFRYNYPVGYRYPIGYNYPIYPSLCTEINKDPFATSIQIECCPGLTQCLADWNNDNNPYYLCKKSCDE
jgi:hypothetical protein